MNEEIDRKEYTVVMEFISEHTDDFSRRFSNIIQAALIRTVEAERFFSSAAHNAADDRDRSFFLHLTATKALHRRIIEKLGRKSDIDVVPGGERMSDKSYPVVSSADAVVEKISEPPKHGGNLLEVVCDKAIDELDFYLNFLLIEKHPVISSLLLSLANLSKDFLFEAKLRYLERQSRIETDNPEKIVEHFLNLEHRYN